LERAKAQPLAGLRAEDIDELAVSVLGYNGASEEDLSLASNACANILVFHPSAPSARRIDDDCARIETALKKPSKLSAEALSNRAKAFQTEGELRKASFDADAVLKEKTAPASARCRAATVRALVVAKPQKQDAADAWGVAMKECEGDAEQVVALYTGAKASVSAGRSDEALARFKAVEEKFPAHRFADDARFRAALVLRDQGDLQGFEQQMLSIPGAYPDGDMKGEALFRIALAAMNARDFAHAADLLDRHIAQVPDDLHWTSAGRARYFRARLFEIAGNLEASNALYEQVLREVPLAYYSAMAGSRLRERDAARVEKALAAGRQRDAASPRELFLPPPGIENPLALLCAENVENAKREFTALGMLGKEATQPSLLATAQLFNQGEQWSSSVSLYRSQFTAHTAHHPEGVYRAMWEAGYPPAYRRELNANAHKDVPHAFVWAIMREESSFMAEVKSPVGAIGLMQLMPETARITAQDTGLSTDEASLKRPEVSIALGTKLLAKLRGNYSHIALAIAAYNAGPGAVQRWVSTLPSDIDLWVESVSYEETRGYIKRVLSSYYAYAALYDEASMRELKTLSRWVHP
jgi:soluble lytic murein transglycosylase